MAETFDLVVLGTGTAGSGVARRCRAAGWSVAIVDDLPYGGTCALRGCDPKKVLVGAAEALDWVRRMDGKGIGGRSAAIRWSELQQFKRTFTDPVPEEAEAGLAKAGVRTFHGRARFTGRTTVQVGEDVLNARHVLIATGAQPAPQPYPGAEHLMTSDRFLELYELPGRIVFVGGGYVSFEFAHFAARAGSQVTILHRGCRPLERFDPDLVGLLLERTLALGIDVQLRTEVRGVARSGSGFTVHAMSEGVSREFEGDLVVHGAGRMPALAGLDLDRAGVAWDRRGVKVDEFLQSVTNPAVYAAGDAAGSGPPLTPVAGVDARVVAANLLDGNHQTPDYSGVASVVFTIPALASVGLTEEAARAQERKFRVRHERTSDWYTAKRVAEEAYGYKTLVEDATERILGAHLLGPHAEEVINLFALAVRKGLTTRDLKDVVFAYPTAGSDLPYML